MTHNDADRLTVGTQLAHRDGTAWTVHAVPTDPTTRQLILAELVSPTGGRGYLTADNLAEFIPERPRCVERDAIEHWTCVLAWGTPDRRVASALAAENQRGRWRRQKVIGKRALEARWPVETATAHLTRQAQRRALKRLEGDYHDLRTVAARNRPYKSRSEAYVAERVEDGTEDGLVRPSIFDE